MNNLSFKHDELVPGMVLLRWSDGVFSTKTFIILGVGAKGIVYASRNTQGEMIIVESSPDWMGWVICWIDEVLFTP